ncbi:hypothetical protein SBADM41S_04055 [Streptomyces badius]
MQGDGDRERGRRAPAGRVRPVDQPQRYEEEHRHPAVRVSSAAGSAHPGEQEQQVHRRGQCHDGRAGEPGGTGGGQTWSSAYGKSARRDEDETAAGRVRRCRHALSRWGVRPRDPGRPPEGSTRSAHGGPAGSSTRSPAGSAHAGGGRSGRRAAGRGCRRRAGAGPATAPRPPPRPRGDPGAGGRYGGEVASGTRAVIADRRTRHPPRAPPRTGARRHLRRPHRTAASTSPVALAVPSKPARDLQRGPRRPGGGRPVLLGPARSRDAASRNRPPRIHTARRPRPGRRTSLAGAASWAPPRPGRTVSEGGAAPGRPATATYARQREALSRSSTITKPAGLARIS